MTGAVATSGFSARVRHPGMRERRHNASETKQTGKQTNLNPSRWSSTSTRIGRGDDVVGVVCLAPTLPSQTLALSQTKPRSKRGTTCAWLAILPDGSLPPIELWRQLRPKPSNSRRRNGETVASVGSERGKQGPGATRGPAQRQRGMKPSPPERANRSWRGQAVGGVRLRRRDRLVTV
ncbi:hypothetical protein RJ55_07266 [Drechmeria coniospora]|nr:hypothetical protein RJ55_07266 [Drechmeria coniospora]